MSRPFDQVTLDSNKLAGEDDGKISGQQIIDTPVAAVKSPGVPEGEISVDSAAVMLRYIEAVRAIVTELGPNGAGLGDRGGSQ
jgi:hypothetical protein